MAKSQRRLGRGLSSLIADVQAPEAAIDSAAASRPTTRDIPVDAIAPNPRQPRSQFSPQSIEELAQSIRNSGVIQPIVVRPSDGGYQLVAGERRWRAAKQAGLTAIPAVIRQVSEQQLLEFALIENVQREDLNAIDRAQAYRQCCNQFGITPDALAEHLGENRTTVVNYLRLLDLPESVRDLVRAGQLTMGHARALLGLSDPAHMAILAEEAIAQGMTVRQLESTVRTRRDQPPPDENQQKQPSQKRALIEDLEERFAEALQTRVTIHEGRKKNTGRIVIRYYSVDDFDRVAEKLGVQLEEL